MRGKLVIGFGLLCLLAGCGSAVQEQNQDMQKKADAFYKIGAAEYQAGNLTEATKYLEKAKKINPNDAKIYHAFGLVYVSLRKYSEAIASCQKALRVDPTFVDAHNALGTIYGHLGEWDKAIAEFRQALSSPMYKTPELAHYNLGLALMEKGDHVSAVKEFHTAIEMYPNFPRALDQYGIALYKLNRNQEAVKRFKQAIDLDQDFIDPYLNLGLVYMKQGKRDDAIQQFKAVLERSNDEKMRSEAERYLEMLE